MIIETERLILRPFTENDAEDVYEYYIVSSFTHFIFRKHFYHQFNIAFHKNLGKQFYKKIQKITVFLNF